MVYILGAVACVSMSFICKFYCHSSEHVFFVYMYVICILFLKHLKCWDIISHVMLFHMDGMYPKPFLHEKAIFDVLSAL